jgi:hypothetical protein
VEHIFLQKVGGGYMFVHRSLLDYFAAPDPVGQSANASTPTVNRSIEKPG